MYRRRVHRRVHFVQNRMLNDAAPLPYNVCVSAAAHTNARSWCNLLSDAEKDALRTHLPPGADDSLIQVDIAVAACIFSMRPHSQCAARFTSSSTCSLQRIFEGQEALGFTAPLPRLFAQMQAGKSRPPLSCQPGNFPGC